MAVWALSRLRDAAALRALRSAHGSEEDDEAVLEEWRQACERVEA